MNMSDLQVFQEKLGYSFKDIKLLRKALSHSSYANERKVPLPNNERLEFLGDSVLGMVAATYLFRNHNGPEGEMTKIRASLVCEKALFSYASDLEFGEYLLLGNGEQRNGGATRPSILSDAFEAVIAAIFLDADDGNGGGIKAAENFIEPIIKRELERRQTGRFRDFKTALQEIIQQNPEERLEYALAGESGPDHEKVFLVEVHLNSNVIGRGRGKNKKEAEQQAAREALSLMGYDDI